MKNISLFVGAGDKTSCLGKARGCVAVVNLKIVIFSSLIPPYLRHHEVENIDLKVEGNEASLDQRSAKHLELKLT